jgi:hypothetical protein
MRFLEDVVVLLFGLSAPIENAADNLGDLRQLSRREDSV